MPTNFSFEGLVPEFHNRGIHTLLTEIFEFRPQVTTRPERMAQGGWNDELNNFLMQGLEDLANTLERITWRDITIGKEQAEKNAADTGRSLKSDFSAQTINVQGILQPPGQTYKIAHDLSGAHVDYPQMTTENCPNAWFRNFITGLDGLAVEVSRLTSRNLPVTISANESAMIRARLIELYGLCQVKGGEPNRQDRPTGTLPSQEPAKLAAGQANA